MLSVSTQLARGDDLHIFEQMLKSVAFADELIIFNMDREDAGAKALYQRYNARVINVKTPRVVEEIRGEQVRAGQFPWVLVMDFDEVVPPDLAHEIEHITESPVAASSAYLIKRHNYSLGMPLKYGGWGSDQVVRLLHRESFIAWPAEIHSLPRLTGELGQLEQAMEHHKDASLEQMVEKTNRYSDIEAAQFYTGRLARVTPLTLMRKWWMESVRRGILKVGLLDGAIGLIQSMYQGFSVFISYAKLYELQQKGKP